MSALPLLDAAQLRELAARHRSGDKCPVCGGLQCKGWEALPAAVNISGLRRVGTLRDPELYEVTVEEYHPDGTHSWSPDAPIAAAFHPANKSDVWQCSSCGRVFLRYTEYGGYYQEERVREVDPALIVDAALP
ncbi:hypothetical protein ACPWT1_06550 [Ramlibacter sp. MMS24-I3-19]|uniref:hypothetical protein n=1 Tax=Ramlibacter sp. MMS24-I3-19 TaxID=3416606 RepID=UPI003D0289E5